MFKITLPFRVYLIVSTIIATSISGLMNTLLTYIFYDLLGDQENPPTMGAIALDVVVTTMLTALNAWFLGGHFCMLDTRGHGVFDITRRPQLDSIPKQLHFLLYRAQAWVLDDVCTNLRQWAVTGFLLGVVETATVGVIFILAGKYALNVESIKELLIYKFSLGAIVGFENHVLVTILAATVIEEEGEVKPEVPALQQKEMAEEDAETEESPVDVESQSEQ
jgi:hypothetical protein